MCPVFPARGFPSFWSSVVLLTVGYSALPGVPGDDIPEIGLGRRVRPWAGHAYSAGRGWSPQNLGIEAPFHIAALLQATLVILTPSAPPEGVLIATHGSLRLLLRAPILPQLTPLSAWVPARLRPRRALPEHGEKHSDCHWTVAAGGGECDQEAERLSIKVDLDRRAYCTSNLV